MGRRSQAPVSRESAFGLTATVRRLVDGFLSRHYNVSISTMLFTVSTIVITFVTISIPGLFVTNTVHSVEA